jgi:transposase
MAATTGTFAQWLTQARIPEHALTAEQRAVLQAAFRFRQSQGTDYYSTRLLSHFLLHGGLGLKVAQLARLVGVSRPTASRQQGLSSKEAIQQARHRLDGRPYGKLLPRYAGPIAQFLCTHPQATRYDVLDFIDHTFGVRVSRIALYKFLKKYGLDHIPEPDPGDAPPAPLGDAPPTPVLPAAARGAGTAPPFWAGTRSTPAPSC